MKKVRLAEVAEIEISNIDKRTRVGETLVALCNYTDVYKNWAISEKHIPNFLQASASASQICKFKLSKGQVAITKDSETRDDIGISCLISNNFENTVLGYHCALITPDSNQLDGGYLNAFLHSDQARRYFENNASGSGMRFSLSKKALQDTTLLLPSIKEQRKIANIFSLIDQKISLNEEINRNLFLLT